jgi:hypothetical protein
MKQTKFFFYAGAVILTALVLFSIAFAISAFVDGKVFAGIGCLIGTGIAGYADYLLISRYRNKSDD